MRAEILQQDKGYTAIFERKLPHGAEQVWNMLADNDKLRQWFKELQIVNTGKGRKVIFDLGEGKREELTITDYEEGQTLAFDWWGDHVRFEVESERESLSILRMTETIHRLTQQTVKDLAGWHVCLDEIEALLKGEKVDRENEWQYWHAEYERLVKSMQVEFE